MYCWICCCTCFTEDACSSWLVALSPLNWHTFGSVALRDEALGSASVSIPNPLVLWSKMNTLVLWERGGALSHTTG